MNKNATQNEQKRGNKKQCRKSFFSSVFFVSLLWRLMHKHTLPHANRKSRLEILWCEMDEWMNERDWNSAHTTKWNRRKCSYHFTYRDVLIARIILIEKQQNRVFVVRRQTTKANEFRNRVHAYIVCVSMRRHRRPFALHFFFVLFFSMTFNMSLGNLLARLSAHMKCCYATFCFEVSAIRTWSDCDDDDDNTVDNWLRLSSWMSTSNVMRLREQVASTMTQNYVCSFVPMHINDHLYSTLTTWNR